MSFNEAQLYNLYSGGFNDKHLVVENVFLKSVLIRHFRYEHKMKIRDIAKRMNMKMKTVKELMEKNPGDFKYQDDDDDYI